jgi:hypothetical protein
MNRRPGEDCPDCEGTGYGQCGNCGDLYYQECACDDPQESDCDSCEGTGKNPPDEAPEQDTL